MTIACTMASLDLMLNATIWKSLADELVVYYDFFQGERRMKVTLVL